MTTPNLRLTCIKLGDSATPANNFLISVPDVANGKLTIEREDGTDVLAVDAAGKVTIAGQMNNLQVAKAWVSFDMTRNAAGGTDSANTARFIRAAFNVASVVKNATGGATVTLTSALADANYCVTGSASSPGVQNGWLAPNGARLASSFALAFYYATANPFDATDANVTVFGN